MKGLGRFTRLMLLMNPLLLVLLAFATSKSREDGDGRCKYKRTLAPRPHSVSITEFGAVGDGLTMNTLAFQNAIFYLRSFADKGGAQLYVPKGKWLTGSFNLTSHLTLFLDKGAVIIGNQDISQWPITSPLPSYGRGIDIPGDSNIEVQNITIHAPSDSPFTNGIVPDSCSDVCIEDSSIAVGHDAITLKSGWDEYGISYGRSSSEIHISKVFLQSPLGSALAFGSEMSGGISNIRAEHLRIYNSRMGINFKTTRGRGGFMEEILVSDVEIHYVETAVQFTGYSGGHADDKYDPSALPVINRITIKNVMGTNISVAGALYGIEHDPFTAICLSNISMTVVSEVSHSWTCSNVSGFSQSVFPEPCSELQIHYSNSSLLCYSFVDDYEFSPLAIA
ncbi:hypothetical protein HPP92_010665 [Vanilla planifolia]|uniref:Polygalacturonase n=1 Tax=Vanilla planifolia TaxID=51239 RepID=A0A835R465_VANPL|nr:hypothetical protein HPP92_010665 [Vanilla planifolia]